MAAAFQQQIFALDARFNAYRAPNNPNFKTLYIRRRSQLLRENAKFKDIETIKKYLHIRSQLLQRRYGVQDNISISSASSRQRSSSKASLALDDFPQSSNNKKKNEMSISENYAFTGVHHIFDQHSEQVSVVKFANNDRSKLACASHDGSVSICDVTASPPRVSFVLEGHTQPVTGCDWSASNELVVSVGLDGLLVVWDVARRARLRAVPDQLRAPLLAVAFQPANNNMVIPKVVEQPWGAQASPSPQPRDPDTLCQRRPLNVTFADIGWDWIVSPSQYDAGYCAGDCPEDHLRAQLRFHAIILSLMSEQGGSSILGGRVLSIACESSGQMFWAANDKGVIVSYRLEGLGGALSKLRRCCVDGAVSCLSWSPWLARHPALLASVATDTLYLFRIADRDGTLALKKRFSTMHREHSVKSTFCPIMSFRRGVCVVTGGEDATVYFLDIEGTSNQPVVNKLQGHASPVLGVSFSYDESLLATSDASGLVIIWRRP